MDPSLIKKRKADENGTIVPVVATILTPEDTRKIIEPFTQEQLLEILTEAASRHLDVLDAIRAIADRDPTQRKLFIRGLGWDTTTEGLRTLFSSYGELDEAVVILDKVTGKSKGYGFVTFKHIDGAMLALKEPSKKIDGRMTVTQLAASGTTGPTANAPPVDVSARKIYVGSVPVDMPADRLLAHFSSYGEIEEGPLGFDKQTGKSRGFALFVYKTTDAARASLVDPTKTIDGHQLVCKLAIDGKKKPGVPVSGGGAGGGQAPTGGVQGGGGDGSGDGIGIGMQPPSSMQNSLSSHYGASNNALSSYGGYPGGHQGLPPPHHHHHPLASSLQSSIGGNPGLSSVGGSQVPPSLGGGTGGYGVGLGGSFGGGLGSIPTTGGYGGVPSAGGGYGPYGALGAGASLYRPGSFGMPSGFPETGHYGLSSSAFPGQHHPASGSSPVPRVPPGGMYQSIPPYN